MLTFAKNRKLQYAETILVENAIIITCCPARTKALQAEYDVKVMHSIENSIVKPPHCQMGCINA